MGSLRVISSSSSSLSRLKMSDPKADVPYDEPVSVPTQGPSWGYIKVIFFGYVVIFLAINAHKWLQGRAKDFKNEHGMLPRRASSGAAVRAVHWCMGRSSFLFFIALGLELSDTKVYEP